MIEFNNKDKLSLVNDINIGIKAAFPICIGYIPLGIASGILSQKAGLSIFQIGILSIFVYAGSGQFITSAMLISHASMLSIVFTTFIVNLRHLLLSSTLAPFFKNCKKRFLMFFASEITDESFAINLIKFKSLNWSPRRAVIVNITSHFTWITSNMIGGFTGSIFSFNSMIINFVLTSMFICLLCLQFKSFIYVLCAIISGFIAICLSLIMNNNLYVIIATIITATLCYFIEKLLKRKKEHSLGN